MRTRRTPCVERPACRISPESMRIILPSRVTIISSESSFTDKIATTLPVLRVVFMLITPDAAVGEPVVGKRRALAVSVLGNGKNQPFLGRADSFHFRERIR